MDMTLVYIAWGEFGQYAGFPDVLECAKRRSNCPIWVISDQPDPGGVNYIPMSEFPIGNAMRAKFSKHSDWWRCLGLSRWYVLRDFIRTHEPAFPVFCSDWDVMIFRDLAEAYVPFADCDYAVSVTKGCDSAAYCVNRMEPLEAYCNLIEKLSDEGDPRTDELHDMYAWQLNRENGDWKVGDLFEIHDGSVFDHNIHVGEDRFEMDGEAKKVVFRDGLPYFFLHDGSPILANTIHCWGTYKTRTAELLQYVV